MGETVWSVWPYSTNSSDDGADVHVCYPEFIVVHHRHSVLWTHMGIVDLFRRCFHLIVVWLSDR